MINRKGKPLVKKAPRNFNLKKTKHSPTRHTPEQVEQARKMFFDYKTWEEISGATGLSKPLIGYYAKARWREERDARKNSIISILGESKGEYFAEINNMGLQLLRRSLQEHIRQGTILSVKEAMALQQVITSVDKIIRLDDGTPTDIVKDIKPATRNEVIELVNADPFAKKMELIYEENTDSDSDDDGDESSFNSENTALD